MKPEKNPLFKNSGLKSTNQRNLVYSCLNNTKQPLTAEGIFLRIKAGSQRLSLSTVYRALDALIRNGIAAKTVSARNGVAQYELVQAVHRHTLTCTTCGDAVFINGCPLTNFDKAVEQNTDYIITGHRLQMLGLCPKCK